MSGSSPTRVQRRLAAILAADVVGYSSLMGQDEEGTLRRVKQLRHHILQPSVEAHQGRIFKAVGDGFLAEFSSPVEAVRCALAVQDILTEDAPNNSFHSLEIRIGINLGDIIVEEDGDVYGDGVNIATRLEQLAEPGSICISGPVYDQVEGKVGRPFESLGDQRVKNIAKSIRVYVPRSTRALRSTPATTQLPLPDRPSIAVLPFTNMSGDPEQEYFADGITEDIISALSRLQWLWVIARNSTFTFKGRAVDVREVSRALGVRYVLEGSVRTSGNRIRINGQLIDAASGKHLWAEKYDRQVTDIFALQDEITESVVAALEPRLYAEEDLRARTQSPESISTWGLVVRAINLVNRVGRQANEDARKLLNQAIQAEPSYAKAHALMGWAVWWAAFNYWLPDETVGRQEAQRHAEAALLLDPNEPWARMVLGFALSAGESAPALQELETALRINPSFALAHAIYGWALARAGRYEAALEATSKALRLSPSDTYLGLYEFIHGIALLVSCRFDEALPLLRRAVRSFPDLPSSYGLLISCCGHLGLLNEVQPLLVRRNELGPPLTLTLNRQNVVKYAFGPVITEGLAKAGVPER